MTAQLIQVATDTGRQNSHNHSLLARNAEPAYGRRMFSHIVIFWTDRTISDATERLIKGAEKHLKPIPGVLLFHIGRRVPSTRRVVEQTFDVALNVVFASQEAREAYRAHERHEYSTTCTRCLVYDFEG